VSSIFVLLPVAPSREFYSCEGEAEKNDRPWFRDGSTDQSAVDSRDTRILREGMEVLVGYLASVRDGWENGEAAIH
jgi:hypothetical protein